MSDGFSEFESEIVGKIDGEGTLVVTVTITVKNLESIANQVLCDGLNERIPEIVSEILGGGGQIVETKRGETKRLN
jgi:hypothetical protein